MEIELCEAEGCLESRHWIHVGAQMPYGLHACFDADGELIEIGKDERFGAFAAPFPGWDR